MGLPSGVMLVIPTLQSGGAELVMSRLAGWLHRNGSNVSLLTFDRSESEWPLQSGVRRLFLNDHLPGRAAACENMIVEALRRVFAMERPGTILSFLTRMNIRTLKARPANATVIVCERSYPPARAFPPRLTREIVELYPSAQALVLQTERCRRDWADAFMPRHKTWVLPNACFLRPPGADDPRAGQPPQSPYVVALGRLTPEKGFFTLLEAFAEARSRIPSLSLLIAGEGPQREQLLAKARKLGVPDGFFLPGFCEDIGPILRNALCFVLPSQYEGFPNALLEAMWHGAACVAADCPAGPEELLGQTRGILFPPGDSAALAQILLRLYADARLRASLGAAASLHARQFTEDVVFFQWAALLRETTSDTV